MSTQELTDVCRVESSQLAYHLKVLEEERTIRRSHSQRAGGSLIGFYVAC
jgi:hypothetical protein